MNEVKGTGVVIKLFIVWPFDQIVSRSRSSNSSGRQLMVVIKGI